MGRKDVRNRERKRKVRKLKYKEEAVVEKRAIKTGIPPLSFNRKGCLL